MRQMTGDYNAALRMRRYRERLKEKEIWRIKREWYLRRLAAALDRQTASHVRGSRATERTNADKWVRLYRKAANLDGACIEDEPVSAG